MTLFREVVMAPRLQKKDKPLSRKITFRVNEEEYKQIEQSATSKGFLFIGPFVRKLVLETINKNCN